MQKWDTVLFKSVTLQGMVADWSENLTFDTQ